ncbi:MAG: precorrin-2 dehydrogenase [Fusobacteriaceae bacterium]|nr:siroheme synthase [Fusobacteriales bacterium]MDN5303375.1 precorrin-2 dehydrogenase [Fusobacteriaceae bacterium]
MNRYIPIFLDSQNKNIAILGAGKIAERKIKTFLDSFCNITIFSAKIKSNYIDNLIKKEKIEYIKKEININEIEFLEKFDIIICATNDVELNNYIYEKYKDKKLINNASEYKKGNFIIGSIIKRGEFLLSFTTSGVSPLFSKYFKKYLESKISKNLDVFLEKLSKDRKSHLKGIDFINLDFSNLNSINTIKDTENEQNNLLARKIGIIVITHGSKNPDFQGEFDNLLKKLESATKYKTIGTTLLDEKEIDVEKVFGENIKRIIVIPYFLFIGKHLKKDIPEIFNNLEIKYPNINFYLTNHLEIDDFIIKSLINKFGCE